MDAEKGMRLLHIYQQLTEGRGVQKQAAAALFGVNERSIQRDIEDIRNFLAEQDPPKEVRYIPSKKRYELISGEQTFLNSGEALAVCKVLLESRSMKKADMDAILDKLLSACVAPEDRQAVDRIISNERFYYIEPHHGKALIDQLWTLAQAIQAQTVLQVRYRTQTGKEKRRTLHPVGLMFSEFYFYLTAFIEDIDRAECFENPEDLSPTIYRVDRLEQIAVLDRHFTVPYAKRFSEGEFRKRVQFMYGGRLQIVRFTYSGPSVEAVLDRLPTAEILSEKDGVYEIRAEVFGKGIEMWLRSQGSYVSMPAASSTLAPGNRDATNSISSMRPHRGK